MKNTQYIEYRNAIEKIIPISNQVWNDIEEELNLSSLQKDEYFSKENQYLKKIGFISSGILRIFYLDDNGNEWNKHFLTKNDFVAESINPYKKSITNIQALNNTEIIYLDFNKFKELSEKHSSLKTFMQKLTYNYLEQKEKRQINFMSNTSIENYKLFKEKYPNLENEISQYHIASYLSITPTQLSRIRKKMKNI